MEAKIQMINRKAKLKHERNQRAKDVEKKDTTDMEKNTQDSLKDSNENDLTQDDTGTK